MNKTLITLSIVVTTINLVTACAEHTSTPRQQLTKVNAQLNALHGQRRSRKIVHAARRLRTKEKQLWQKMEAADHTLKIATEQKTAASAPTPTIGYSQEAIRQYRMANYMSTVHGWFHRENVASGELARRIRLMLNQS